jgi:hypothetical protein
MPRTPNHGAVPALVAFLLFQRQFVPHFMRAGIR